MTNQAAQTMPAMTPKRCSFFLRRFKNDEKMLGPNEQLALDYAIAALSQSAGVVEPGRYFASGPQGHFFADDLQLARDLVNLYDKDDDWTITDLRNPTGAAPAASGGEDDMCPNCVTPWKCNGPHESTGAAPVSERARELRERAEAHGGGVFVSIGDIRAIEQALTQQRDTTPQPSADAVREVPDGMVLVPARMELTPENMETLVFMLGGDPDAKDVDERWNGGTLWVGETIGDNGEKYYGLNVANVECYEEGSVPIVEFAAAIDHQQNAAQGGGEK